VELLRLLLILHRKKQSIHYETFQEVIERQIIENNNKSIEFNGKSIKIVEVGGGDLSGVRNRL
jgi:hypothetical protein